MGRDCHARGAKTYMSAGELPEPGAIEHGVAGRRTAGRNPVERVVIAAGSSWCSCPWRCSACGSWPGRRERFPGAGDRLSGGADPGAAGAILDRVMPRGLAILSVYLGLVAVVVGIGFLLVSPVSTQIRHFEDTCRS